MGKRRSNRNKKKKNGKNMLQNYDKKVSSVSDQEEKNSKNYCTPRAQEEPTHVQLSSHNFLASCKKLTEIHESNPKNLNEELKLNLNLFPQSNMEKDKSVTTENISVQFHRNLSKNLNAENIPSISYDAEESKLPGEICSTLVNKPQSSNHYSSFTSKCELKPVTSHFLSVCPREISESDIKEEIPVNYSLQNSDKNKSMSYSPVKESIVTGMIKPNSGSRSCPNEQDNRLIFFATSQMDESCESEEYSDFLKPVFDDWHTSKNNNVFGDENFHGKANDSSFSAENTSASEARCSGYRNSSEKPGFDGTVLKVAISCVHAYKLSKQDFSNIYHTWLPQRRKTLRNLGILKADIHKSQMSYNRSQEALRQTDLMARSGKNSDSQVIDFVASFSAFLSDAASGIVSVVQAYNLDWYQNKLKEIMELDTEITRQLYKARSQSVAKYHDIEEVMRSFHSDNFSSTMDKISNSLEVGKYWEDIKKAYEKKNIFQLSDILLNFVDNANKPTQFEEVSDAIAKYIDDNPAAHDAVKYTLRATYGAIDTFNCNQNKPFKGINFVLNQFLMLDDIHEIQRLQSTMEEYSPQSKLEFQIQDAIDRLQCELEEIENIFFELFKSDSECDSLAYY